MSDQFFAYMDGKIMRVMSDLYNSFLNLLWLDHCFHLCDRWNAQSNILKLLKNNKYYQVMARVKWQR